MTASDEQQASAINERAIDTVEVEAGEENADDALPSHTANEDQSSMKTEEGSDFVLRARGLPWSATVEDIEKFFSGCQIEGGADGIHFTFSKDGRPSGECFVQFASHDDFQKALLKNNEHMGKRYVEVFESKKSEMDWVCKRMGNTTKESGDESVVRLRGLPFGCSKEEVANFFKGLEIAPNGITIAHDEEGKNTGDGYVEFASPEIANQAMNKHKEKIGHRYIEIFPSNIQEARSALQPKPKPLMSTRPGPYDRRGFNNMGSGRFGGQQSGFERRYRGGGNSGGGRGGFGNDFGGNMRGRGGRNNFGGNFGGNSGGYGGRDSGGGGGSGGLSKSSTGFCVHMRGIPYSASESDIKQWLLPLNPVAIRMEFEIRGSGQRRSSGEADVDFASQADAKAAMSKDRQMMGHRYIELFLRSESDNNDDDWGSNAGGAGNDRSFFSGGAMNYSGGGYGGNQFGNSGNYGNSGGGGGNYGSGGGNGNYGGNSGGGGGNFGGGSTPGNSGYGGGYGGSSGGGGQSGGQAGSYGSQTGTSFFGVQMPNQSGGPTSLMGNTSTSTGFQQQTGYNQTNPPQDVTSYSSTSAGAFNSASSFYSGDSKSGMVSYPTSY